LFSSSLVTRVLSLLRLDITRVALAEKEQRRVYWVILALHYKAKVGGWCSYNVNRFAILLDALCTVK